MRTLTEMHSFRVAFKSNISLVFVKFHLCELTAISRPTKNRIYSIFVPTDFSLILIVWSVSCYYLHPTLSIMTLICQSLTVWILIGWLQTGRRLREGKPRLLGPEQCRRVNQRVRRNGWERVQRGWVFHWSLQDRQRPQARSSQWSNPDRAVLINCRSSLLKLCALGVLPQLC